jgi:hypothetical protein
LIHAFALGYNFTKNAALWLPLDFAQQLKKKPEVTKPDTHSLSPSDRSPHPTESGGRQLDAGLDSGGVPQPELVVGLPEPLLVIYQPAK